MFLLKKNYIIIRTMYTLIHKNSISIYCNKNILLKKCINKNELLNNRRKRPITSTSIDFI